MIKKIIKKDLKTIFKKPKVIIVLIALILIPTAYATVSISSLWDPMGHIDQLDIGVVNEDGSAISNTIVTKLQESNTFSFVSDNYTEGYNKLENGTYYALIVIPSDFTDNIKSINTTNPTSAKVQFLINSKYSTTLSNTLNNGGNTMQSNINNNIVSTVNGIIFDELVEGSNIAINKINNLETKWNQIDSKLFDYYTTSQRVYNNMSYASHTLQTDLNNFMAEHNLSDERSNIIFNNFNTRLNGVNSQINILNNKRLNIDNNITYFNNNYMPLINKMSDYNVNDVKDYFNSPVIFNKTDIHHLNSYGDVISTFYIPLSLYIGAILLISMLSVRVKGFKVKAYQEYFGKIGLFMILSIIQATILTIVMMFLNIEYSNPWLLLGSNIFIGLSFTILLYSLVSAFGNIGKFIGIVLMVFSIPNSGGMYPIQLITHDFQFLNKMLPLTYGIKITKEVITAPIMSVIITNAIYLSVFTLIGIALVLLIKPFIYNKVKNTESEMKESDLFFY